MSRARLSMDSASRRRLSGSSTACGIRKCAAGAGDHRERRAQVVRDRRQQCVAQALGLGLDPRRFRACGELDALERQRDLAGKSLEQVALLGKQHAAPVGRLHCEHAQCRVRAQQRQVQRRRGGQGIGPQPGALTVVGHPLCDRQVGRRAARRRAAVPPGVGADRSRPAAGSPPCCRRPPRRASLRQPPGSTGRAWPQARGSSRTATPCAARGLPRPASAAARSPSAWR